MGGVLGDRNQLLPFTQDPAQGLPGARTSLLLGRKDGAVERCRDEGGRMEGWGMEGCRVEAGGRGGKHAKLTYRSFAPLPLRSV